MRRHGFARLQLGSEGDRALPACVWSPSPSRAGTSAPRSLAELRAQCRRASVAASQAVQQPSQPAAPQPTADQTARAMGAEERINAAYIRGAIK